METTEDSLEALELGAIVSYAIRHFWDDPVFFGFLLDHPELYDTTGGT